MEPSATPSPRSSAVLGELVVGNGRLIGTRRAMTGPLTLIGEGTGCDVRLHSDKVAPFHCVLIHGPHGFVLRDLDTKGGTLVNGKPVETQPLRHGDRIEVGPFHLVLELPAGAQEADAPTAPALEAERDALRIQAAAVVAQQAALTEEELRLQQRRGGLERQEEQLAKHLEEKRRHLVELREQLHTERDAFKEQRATEERELAARRAEAEEAFAEGDGERKLSQKERARFVELRKRLKQRWENHFEAHEEELRKREDELNAGADRLVEEAEELERGHAALSEQRLQHNGEMELGRRQLEAAWDELSLSQQEWGVSLNREKQDYEQRMVVLAEREVKAAAWEQELADTARNQEQRQVQLKEEAEGLDVRVRNQRLKLQSLEKAQVNLDAASASRRAASAPVLALPPVPEPAEVLANRLEAPVALKRLAGCLSDQRLHLLEQWQRVIDLQDQWQRQREAVLTELEDSGHRLDEREQRIGEREQQLTTWAVQLEQRRDSLAQLHCSLEGRQARLTAGALDWETERARVLAGAQAAEESAVARVRQLTKLCRRAFKRHHVEATALQEARSRCEEVRQQYALLGEECRERTTTLLRDQQALAGETLSVERLRLELLGRTENAAATEKRLDKLRRQSQGLVERAEAELKRERTALQAEAGRLDERGQTLRQEQEHIGSWRQKLAKRQRRWDERVAAAQDAELQRTQEMQRMLAQHEQDANQLRELREEVERLARLMMEEAGNGSASSQPLAARLLTWENRCQPSVEGVNSADAAISRIAAKVAPHDVNLALLRDRMFSGSGPGPGEITKATA